MTMTDTPTTMGAMVDESIRLLTEARFVTLPGAGVRGLIVMYRPAIADDDDNDPESPAGTPAYDDWFMLNAETGEATGYRLKGGSPAPMPSLRTPLEQGSDWDGERRTDADCLWGPRRGDPLEVAQAMVAELT